MEKILIYSPVDGYVEDISKIKDPTFAAKELGDGIFIVPETNDFYSPIEGSLSMVSDTKHAYFLTSGNQNFLMHIGLETVTLEGKPFDVHVKNQEKINLNKKLVTVDFDYIKDNGCTLETPIVIDEETLKKYDLKKLNLNKKVKRGEVLLQLTEKQIDLTQKITIRREKGKYLKTAEDVIKAIGGIENQTAVSNCATRLRLRIKNHDLVQIEELKKIDLVKGTHWNGDELQVIIGGEVYKVKEYFLKILNNDASIANDAAQQSLKPKVSFGKKLLGMINGIVTPALPMLIGAGVLGGIQAILSIAGLVDSPDPKAGIGLGDLDMFSALLYISSKVGLELIGFAFLYNTVKYLGGDPIMSLFLGLGLTSRYLWGEYWNLFTLFGNDISIKTYEGTVLPMVAAGFLLYYLDKWVKTWMPTSVDIVFRPALVFVTCFFVIMFTIGPMVGLLESVLAQFALLLDKIPFGIGTGIFAFMWQPLVLTGTHVAVVTAVTLPMQTLGESSILYAGLNIAVFAQIGSAIAVMIISKNAKTKQAIAASIPGGIFGITEPIIYGINLPKLWPFLYGLIGALVGGTLSGVLGVEQIQRTGTGVMSLLGLVEPLNIGLGVLCNLVGILTAFTLTLILYKDRKTEATLVKKNNAKLLKYVINKKYLLKSDPQYIENKKQLDEISNNLKNNKDYKLYENLIVSVQKLGLQKQRVTEKFELKKDHFYLKTIKVQDNLEKYNQLAQEYNNMQNDQKLLPIIEKISLKETELEEIKKTVEAFGQNTLKDIKANLQKYAQQFNDQELLKLENNYYNALYSIDISYDVIKPLETIFNLKQEKTGEPNYETIKK